MYLFVNVDLTAMVGTKLSLFNMLKKTSIMMIIEIVILNTIIILNSLAGMALRTTFSMIKIPYIITLYQRVMFLNVTILMTF